MPVFHSGRDVHGVAGVHPDGGLAPFLIISFARRADKDLSAALRCMVDVPVVAASGSEGHGADMELFVRDRGKETASCRIRVIFQTTFSSLGAIMWRRFL